MSQTSGLTVRQHEREGINVPIEFVVDPAHASQVRFSSSSSAAGPTMLRGIAQDISSGGMGLLCKQYLPRMCEGLVRVFAPVVGQTQDDGTPAVELILEQHAKVRRVTLVDREPLFSVGVAFIDPHPGIDGKITELFDRIQKAGTSASIDVVGGSHA